MHCWRTAYRGLLPDDVLAAQSVEARLALWTRVLAAPAPGMVYTAAVDDDGVIGFCAIGPSRDAPDEGELWSLYLDPAHIGRGAGRRLLDRARADLGARWRQATLWVLAGNTRARRVYEAAGWSPDGAEKRVAFGAESRIEVRYRLEL